MKKALIVVDMQKAYFANEALENKREMLLASCNQLVSAARSQGCPIFMLRTLHHREKDTWTLNMLDDNQGYLFEDGEDAAYLDGFDTRETREIVKTRDSGFWQTDLLSQLRQSLVTSVVICGVSTHTCVAATASDAYSANLRVELAIDAIWTHDPKYHDSTLEVLAQEYRITRLHSDDITWS